MKFTLLHRVGAAGELKLRGGLSNQIEEILEYGRQPDQAISLSNDQRLGLAPPARENPHFLPEISTEALISPISIF